MITETLNIDNIKTQLPETAKDIKLNLSNLMKIDNLSPQQLYGTLLASALASNNVAFADAIQTLVESELTPEAIKAVHTANSLMAMNNIYYRFIHLVSDSNYGKLPANLRMNAMANPGVDKIDFEMFALAISAINGCGLCMDSHEKALRKHDVDPLQIQQIIRIAAVIHATAKSL